MPAPWKLSDAAAKQIARLIRSEANEPTPRPKIPGRQHHVSVVSAAVIVQNNSGEDIPPFGIMKPTENTSALDGEIVQPVVKPDDETFRFYLVNGAEELTASSYGTGYLLNRPFPALCAGVPRVGEFWCPTDGAWTLKEGDWGFYCIGPLPASTVAANAFRFMQQVSLPCIQARAVLTEDMCATAGEATIGGFRPFKQSIFRIKPKGEPPDKVYNDFSNAGMSGDDLLITYDSDRLSVVSGEPEPGWIIDNIEHHEEDMITDLDWTLPACCLYYKRRKGAFQFCEPKSPWIEDCG